MRENKIPVFADDILILVYPNEFKEIELFIKQLKVFGLSTNPMKCNYLAPQQITELNKLGQFKTSMKYLG